MGRQTKVIASMAAVLAVAASVPSVAAASPATERRTFSPFGPDGERQVAVSDYRSTGSCSDSFVSGQDGPLRCFSGNFIYDPCFPDPTGEDQALCVRSPRARSGVMLRGAVNAHDGYDSRPNRAPWAVELFDGSMCTFVSGATSAKAGLRLNYMCGGTRVLWGTPNKRAATWTIRKSSGYSGRGWRRVKIKVAWR